MLHKTDMFGIDMLDTKQEINFDYSVTDLRRFSKSSVLSVHFYFMMLTMPMLSLQLKEMPRQKKSSFF